MNKRIRKLFLVVLSICWLGLAYLGYRQLHEVKTDLTTVTLGYQKADPFDIAKQRGEFSKKLKEKGYKVVWKEFQDGTALMQALKSGDIDYARLGDTPPVTAQAAGTDIVYIASGSSKASGSGILVAGDSEITELQELKGKKVAYTKGTSSNYLLLNALEQAGMSADDITWVNLDQSAASVAFSEGEVDAWATWDPMTATAEVQQGAKLLVTGEHDIDNNRDFIISTRDFATDNTELSQLIVDYLEEDMEWANNNESQLVSMLADSLKLSDAIVTKMVERRSYSIEAITSDVLQEQQQIADLFYEHDLIDTKIDVTTAVLAH